MRRLLTLITVPAAILAATTVAAPAASNAPTGTAKSIAPAIGGKRTHFVVHFTTRYTFSTAPDGLDDVDVKVTSPCSGKGFIVWRLGDQEPFAGHFDHATLKPPPGGSNTWCAGRWRGEVVEVTINSTTGDCATDDEPEIDANCQIRKTKGRFAFTVR